VDGLLTVARANPFRFSTKRSGWDYWGHIWGGIIGCYGVTSVAAMGSHLWLLWGHI